MTHASRYRRATVSAPSAGATLAAAVALAGLFSGSCASTPPPPPPPPPAAATKSVPPEALAGNWLLEVKMGSRTLEGGLHFANSKGVLVGSWTSADGNEYELKKISISGDQISWDVDGPSGSQHATGKIDGLSMKGTMKRAAGRRGDGSADPSGQGDSAGSGEPSRGGAAGGRSGGGRGGRGRRGGSGGGGGTGITWSAWKTLVPAGESAQPPPPAATPPAGL